MYKIKFPVDYFWSDLHLHHSNILKFYPERPGTTVKEHDDELIVRWNQTVGKEDVALIGGDFTCGGSEKYALQCLERMNGKIIFLRGNHDHNYEQQDMPSNVIELRESVYLSNQPGESQGVHVSHYPTAEWAGNRRGGAHIYGHSHGAYKNPNPEHRMIDIGVDAVCKWNGYFPASWEQLQKRPELKKP